MKKEEKGADMERSFYFSKFHVTFFFDQDWKWFRTRLKESNVLFFVVVVVFVAISDSDFVLKGMCTCSWCILVAISNVYDY